MGIPVNLVDMWEPYKAARLALANTLEIEIVRARAQRHIARVDTITRQLDDYLKEGVLVEVRVRAVRAAHRTRALRSCWSACRKKC